ncbi:MAG: thioredoxin [Gemmatimonadaceae bacterium]|nr:thioredoxin [Gemmatimonadaceae bacterium]
MSNVIAVDDTTFTAAVEGSDAGLVLVDFWAPWCVPCRLMGPVVDAVAAKYAGRLRVVKVDVDRSPLTAYRFGIRSIPTITLFKNGEPVGGFSGFATKATIDVLLRSEIPPLHAGVS